MRVDQVIRYHAQHRPETLALSAGTQVLGYAALNERACQVANGLLAEGVEAGARVAILSENSTDQVVLMLAAGKIGAVAVAVNYRLSGPELAYIIDDCQARVLVVPREADIERVSALSLASTPLLLGCAKNVPGGWLNWALWTSSQSTSEPASTTGAGDAFVQLYTSGTTGRPKGAVISHRNLLDLSFAGIVAAEQRLAIGDNELVVAPLFHIGAVASLFYALMIGVNVILHSSFKPHDVVNAIESHKLKSVFLVPAMIQAILGAVNDLEARDFSTLKRINYGASPIGENLLRRALEVFDCNFQQSYGMTECSGAVAQLTVADHHKALAGRMDLLASCGRQNAAAEMRVVDNDGRELADGELGEVVVRSSTVMMGYWNRPEQTAQAIRNGWLHTGDIGYRNSEGYFFLKDRKKDMVISGGENIYPNEVERVLLNHPAIADVAVIGVPDEKYGEAVLACCVLEPDMNLNEQELISFCRGHLAGYKVPRQFNVIDSLPRNPSGKVLKTELREPYWRDSHRSIG